MSAGLGQGGHFQILAKRVYCCCEERGMYLGSLE